MKFDVILKDFLFGWLFGSNFHLNSRHPELRISWGEYNITDSPTNLTADGIQAEVPQCTAKHPVDANTLIVIPDTYPDLENTAVYPKKVRDNAQIIMTPELDPYIKPVPCNEHVNIVSKVILGIINNEARLVFFPTLSCIGAATDNDIMYMLENLLRHVKEWSQAGKNIVISLSISLYRNNVKITGLIEQILAYENVVWDVAAGNNGLDYCSRNIYSLVGKYQNLAAIGRTVVNPKIPNVIAADSNYGLCVSPYGPGDLTYQKKRVFGTSFVKEIGALNAAFWSKNPTLKGKQILELSLAQIRKTVTAVFPNGVTGAATVFAQGATCAPLDSTFSPTSSTKAPTKMPSTKAPTKTPTKKATLSPTYNTLSPTMAPTMQDFGTFKFDGNGQPTELMPYLADEFCLSIQFDRIGAKNGFASFRLANQCQTILNNITINNPPLMTRYFEIVANNKKTMFNVYRGVGNKRQLAQQHPWNGETIKYIGFDGINAQYKAKQCNTRVSEYEIVAEYERIRRPRLAYN